MILKLRQRMAQDESGFTLVELLVVMLILGLLAAIAIPAFFSQRDKAKDADAKAGVRSAQTAIETFATEHDGHYDGDLAGVPTAATLQGIEETLNSVDLQDPTGLADKTYTVSVVSDTGTDFNITRTLGGTVNLTCGVAGGDPDGGGCSGGTW